MGPEGAGMLRCWDAGSRGGEQSPGSLLERLLFLSYVTHASPLFPKGTHTVTMTVRSGCREETGLASTQGIYLPLLKGPKNLWPRGSSWPGSTAVFREFLGLYQELPWSLCRYQFV